MKMYASENTMLKRKNGGAEPDHGVRVAEARVHQRTHLDQADDRVLVRERPGPEAAHAHPALSATPLARPDCRLCRMFGEPRDEFAILRDGGVYQSIEHVIGRVADEPRVGHERIAVRLL